MPSYFSRFSSFSSPNGNPAPPLTVERGGSHQVLLFGVFLPPATKLGQGYVFTGMCESVHRGVCLNACWDITPPQSRHPPPGAEHAGRYGQRAGGTHPTGMQSCLLSFHILLYICLSTNSMHQYYNDKITDTNFNRTLA